jgi:hypothetical protein
LCRCITDHYADIIDDVNDHSPTFDCLYCPAFDLTRIGKPDWCECPMNRCLDWQCSCNRPYYGPRNLSFSSFPPFPGGEGTGPYEIAPAPAAAPYEEAPAEEPNVTVPLPESATDVP